MQTQEIVLEAAPEPLVTSQPISEVGTDAEAKQFIYFKESSNVLDKVNSQGCYGLGQDCNNVLASECPNWQTDYACQDAFWERYMERRYGSWTAAKQHWEARVPINGRDVGNWW